MQTKTPAGTPCRAPSYLDRPYPRKQKGGTLVHPGLVDVAAHHLALRSPSRVRPPYCPRCRHPALHVHERRPRVLAGEAPGQPTRTEVLIFRCASAPCRAVWRILPLFLARHLWRRWPTVAVHLSEEPPPRPRVAPRTLARWRQRLRSPGAALVLLLAHGADEGHRRLALQLGHGATRGAVLGALGGLLALGLVAALLHALQPGVRVM